MYRNKRKSMSLDLRKEDESNYDIIKSDLPIMEIAEQ